MEKQKLIERLTSNLIRKPSKEEKQKFIKVNAMVLPDKETVLLDDFSGYTKTKIQIQQADSSEHKIYKILEVSEPYFERVYAGHKSLFVYENYKPLIIGQVYTFFVNTKTSDYQVLNQQNQSYYYIQ